MNFLTIFVLVILSISLLWIFKRKMINYNKKQESFIFGRIIIPYRKPMVNKIKIGKKSIFFTNKRDNNDKTRYLIKMEEAYLGHNNILTIDYNFKNPEPRSSKVLDETIIFSNELLSGFENHIIETFRNMMSQELMSMIWTGIKITIIIGAINLILIFMVMKGLNNYYSEMDKYIPYLKQILIDNGYLI